MFFVLHQRRQKRDLISIVVRGKRLKVFVNSRQKAFSGIPAQITIDAQTLYRASLILDSATVAYDVATDKIVFHTDMTRMRGGLPPRGNEFDDPISVVTAVKQARAVFPTFRSWCQSFAKNNPYIAAGIKTMGTFVFTTAIPHLLPWVARNLKLRFVAFIIGKAVDEIIRDFLTPDSDIEPKKEAIKTVIDSYLNAVIAGQPTAPSEQALKQAFLSDKLQARYLKGRLNPDYLPIVNQAATSKGFAQELPNGNAAFLTNEDYFYYRVAEAGRNIFEQVKNKSIEDIECTQQAFELFVKFIVDANPDLQQATDIQIASVYSPLTKAQGIFCRIKKAAASGQDISKNLDIYKMTSYAQTFIGLAGIAVSAGGYFLLHREIKAFREEFAEFREQNEKQYNNLMRAIEESQSKIIKELTEKFADLKVNIAELKQFIEQRFQRVETQLNRIESLIRSTSLQVNISNFINILAQIELSLDFVSLEQTQYSTMQLAVIPWITTHCTSSLLTLSDQTDHENEQLIWELLNKRPLSECIGFLAEYFNQKSGANQIAARSIPDIFVYSQAVAAFCELYLQYSAVDSAYKYSIFKQEGWVRVIEKMLAPGLSAWSLIQSVQKNENFWLKHLIHPYRSQVVLLLNIYQQNTTETNQAIFANLNFYYILLIAFTDLAFNYSANSDLLLQLLLSSDAKKELRLLSGNDIQQEIKDIENKDQRIHVCQLLTELLMNVDLVEAIVLQYSKEVSEKTSQQCNPILVHALTGLNEFAQIELKVSIVSMPELPNSDKFSYAKPAAFYLQNSLFHVVGIANKALIMQCLANPGIDIHQKNSIGETPLHYAARHGYNDVCELLLNHGASQTKLDNFNQTAAELAEKNGHTELAKYLLSKSSLCINPSIPPVATQIWNGEKIMMSEEPISLVEQKQFFIAIEQSGCRPGNAHVLIRFYDASKPGMPTEFRKPWDIRETDNGLRAPRVASPNGKTFIAATNTGVHGFELFHIESDKRFLLQDIRLTFISPILFDNYVVGITGSRMQRSACIQVYDVSTGQKIHAAIPLSHEPHSHEPQLSRVAEEVVCADSRFFRIEPNGQLTELNKDNAPQIKNITLISELPGAGGFSNPYVPTRAGRANKNTIAIYDAMTGAQLAMITSLPEMPNGAYCASQILSERYLLVATHDYGQGATIPTVWDYSANPPQKLYSLQLSIAACQHVKILALPLGDIITISSGGHYFHEFVRMK